MRADLPTQFAQTLRWCFGFVAPGRSIARLPNAILDRNQPPLVIAHLAAQGAIVGKKVAHLVHRTDHSHQLGREADVGLRLSALETIEAGIRVPAKTVEARVRIVHLAAKSVETRVRLVDLVANPLENLNGQIGWLHGVALRQYDASELQSLGQRPRWQTP
jgi:hypothetical protein